MNYLSLKMPRTADEGLQLIRAVALYRDPSGQRTVNVCAFIGDCCLYDKVAASHTFGERFPNTDFSAGALWFEAPHLDTPVFINTLRSGAELLVSTIAEAVTQGWVGNDQLQAA